MFSSKTCDYNTAVHLAVKDSDEFLDAQDCENHESGNTGDGSHAGVRDWCPPMNGRLKLNFDAGVDKQSHRGGIGLVLRDSR